MKESYLWQTIKQGMPEVHWVRIESTAGAGVPDVNGCFAGRDAWVELKMMKGLRLEFRSSQVAWISRRRSAGAANIFVVARKDDWLMVFGSEVVTRPPSRVEDKSVWIEPGEPLLELAKPFNWRLLRDFLFADGVTTRNHGEVE